MSRTRPAPRTQKAPARRPSSEVEKRLATASVVAIFLVPAVIIPGADNRFVFGKVLLGAVGVGCAHLISARAGLPRPTVVVLGIAGVVLSTSASAAPDPVAAILGRAPLYEGAPILLLYVLAAGAGARLFLDDPKRRSFALDVMSVCALVVAALALLEAFGFRPLSSDAARPGSLLGNASDQGAFAVLYGGVLIVMAVANRKPLVVAGAVAAGLTVALSSSRGALLGLASLLIVLGLRDRRARVPMAAALSTLAAAALAIPATRDRLLGLSPFAHQSASGRLLLWRESLHAWLKNPLLGAGPSQFKNAIVAQQGFDWQHSVGPANPPATPHNLILQLLLAGGPLLVILGGVLAWQVVRASRTHGAWGTAVVAGLGAYAVALMFHFPTPATALPGAVLAGSVLAVPRTRPAMSWLRSAFVAAAVAIAGLSVLGGVSEIYLHSARVALASQDAATADAKFSDAESLRWWDADIRAEAFNLLVSAGAYEQAWRWDAKLGTAAHDEQVTQNRVALRLNSNRAADAESLAERALARDRFNPDLLVLDGVAHAELHQLTAARDAFLEATRVQPANQAAWNDLAAAYRQLGQPSLADQAQAHTVIPH